MKPHHLEGGWRQNAHNGFVSNKIYTSGGGRIHTNNIVSYFITRAEIVVVLTIFWFKFNFKMGVLDLERGYWMQHFSSLLLRQYRGRYFSK